MPENKKHENESIEEVKDSQGIPNPSPQFTDKPTSPGVEKNDLSTSDEKLISKNKLDVPGSEKNTDKPGTYLPEPLPPNEERTWAMLAHLSVLLNLITGFLGGAAAIIIYFIYKDRSRLVAYHAMQSFIFQAITWLGAGFLAGIFIAVGSALAFLLIPLLCLIPGFLILLLIPVSLIYGIIGGVKVNNGEDFRYWQIGDWVRDILEPKPIPEN